MPIIETARLALRPWRQDDLAELVRLYADPEVMRHISQGLRVWRGGVEVVWYALDRGTWEKTLEVAQNP